MQQLQESVGPLPHERTIASALTAISTLNMLAKLGFGIRCSHRIHHAANAKAGTLASQLFESKTLEFRSNKRLRTISSSHHTSHEEGGLTELLKTGARLTTAAQMAWAQVIDQGDTVVDATCGNGHDTLFLAQAVGPEGNVYAFDIQESALASTHQRLSALPGDAMPQLHLLQQCHSRMAEAVAEGTAKIVAFNLGYLPCSDKSIITETPTTIEAVKAALKVACPGGLVSIMCYTGHPGGWEEYQAVKELVSGLPPDQWVSSQCQLLNRPSAPIMILLWKQSHA